MEIRDQCGLSAIKTDWKKVILKYEKIDDLLHFIEDERKNLQDVCAVFPPWYAVFRCFKYFNVKDTKVVILGQDPYHSANQATGLCFGVHDVIKAPPSLNNICSELITNVGIDLKSKTLEYWAEQGILLLNSALTVVQNKPASHMKMWLPFTKYIIDYINEHCEKVVFVAWGAFAYKKLMNVNTEKHSLIVSSHPSPLSAYKKMGKFPPFKGSKPFSKINHLLEEKINW